MNNANPPQDRNALSYTVPICQIAGTMFIHRLSGSVLENIVYSRFALGEEAPMALLNFLNIRPSI